MVATTVTNSKLLALIPSSSSSSCCCYGENNNAAQLRFVGRCRTYLVFSLRRKFARPVSSVFSSTEESIQVETQSAQVLVPDQYQPTARVKLQLQKQCRFGDQFLVVGSDPGLGLWNPLEAIPMQWSDGHVWIAELDLPVEESIKFKFILRLKSGQVLWQPGPDRILHLWETGNTICVLENWENAGLQQVSEEENCGHEGELSADTRESFIVADNLSQLEDDKLANNQLICTDEDTNQAPSPAASHDAAIYTPLQEIGNSIGMYHTEESVTIVNSEGLKVGESSADSNGRVPTKQSSQNTATEGYWDNIEDIPILVPGLTPITASPADDTLEQEIIGNSPNAADVMTKIADAKPVNQCSTLSDDLLSTNIVPIQLEKTTEDEPDPDIFNFQQPQADDPSVPPIEPGEATSEDKSVAENPHSAEVEDEVNIGSEQREILENDITWGQKTLKKLLSSLPFQQLRF